MDTIPCQSFVLSHLVIASVQNMHQVNLFGTSVRQPEFADDYFFAEGVKTTRSNRLNFRLSFRPISKGTAKNQFCNTQNRFSCKLDVILEAAFLVLTHAHKPKFGLFLSNLFGSRSVVSLCLLCFLTPTYLPT